MKLNLSKFNFLSDYILVKAIDITESVEGLVKPEQYEDKPQFGEVIQVGTNSSVKKGDTVFFGKYSTEKTRHLGEDYYIIRSEDIIAKK